MSAKAIKLPPPRLRGDVSVEDAINRRRSIRRFLNEPLTLEEISNLLWSAQGITDPRYGFRAAPSAGATYPMEIYLVVKSGGVIDLLPGVYHYHPYEHTLTKILDGDLSRELSYACLGQEWVEEAPVNIVICAIYERTVSRYGERGIRYVHMEAGHIGENVHLQSVALGLGCVMIGAFYDDEVRKLLKLPKDHQPLYVIPVGKPR